MSRPGASPSSVLLVEGVVKRFGRAVALDGFALEVRRGEFLSLLGPSGCGKTTALRVVAGLERPERGRVVVDGRTVADGGTWVPTERRRIGMVFQDWALFPHLDVRGNVAFGLGRDRRDGRVREVLELVGLAGLERRMPHELSGGQQQRVAVARALAPGPALILLDEPFSNLDASLRARVRSEVRHVVRRAGATAVFVTHDQEEALSVADRVAVMADGRVLQVGAPEDVYTAPTDPRVAAILGEGNLLRGHVRSGVLPSPFGPVPAPGVVDGPVLYLVRPETIRLSPVPEGPGLVQDVEFYGHDEKARILLVDGTVVDVRLHGPHRWLRPGARVGLELAVPPRLYPPGQGPLPDPAPAQTRPDAAPASRARFIRRS